MIRKSYIKTLVNTLTTDKYFDTVANIYVPRYGTCNKNLSKRAELWVDGIKDKKKCMYLVGIKNSNYKNPSIVVHLNIPKKVWKEFNDIGTIKNTYIIN